MDEFWAQRAKARLERMEEAALILKEDFLAISDAMTAKSSTLSDATPREERGRKFITVLQKVTSDVLESDSLRGTVAMKLRETQQLPTLAEELQSMGTTALASLPGQVLPALPFGLGRDKVLSSLQASSSLSISGWRGTSDASLNLQRGNCALLALLVHEQLRILVTQLCLVHCQQ